MSVLAVLGRQHSMLKMQLHLERPSATYFCCCPTVPLTDSLSARLKTSSAQEAAQEGILFPEGIAFPDAMAEILHLRVAEPVIKDTLVTERGEVGFDPGSGNQVATAGDPQTGNYKNAAGTVTTAGREDLKMK